jgi:hypothetical protein
VDGLPVVIPAPGSAPPSVAEWDAVTREVTVAGSSALHCQTKMLREWLRVSCVKHANDAPYDVTSVRTDGQEAHVFKSPGAVTSVVVQVVRGKEYRAHFTWSSGATVWGAELAVSWPAAAAKPILRMGPM